MDQILDMNITFFALNESAIEFENLSKHEPEPTPKPELSQNKISTKWYKRKAPIERVVFLLLSILEYWVFLDCEICKTSQNRFEPVWAKALVGEGRVKQNKIKLVWV